MAIVFISLKVCLMVVMDIMSFFKNFHRGYVYGCSCTGTNHNDRVYFLAIIYEVVI